MCDQYPHDESASAHWKVKMGTVVWYLRLALYEPNRGSIREDAHISPAPVQYVPLTELHDFPEVLTVSKASVLQKRPPPPLVVNNGPADVAVVVPPVAAAIISSVVS